jgi:hypothetical protein
MYSFQHHSRPFQSGRRNQHYLGMAPSFYLSLTHLGFSSTLPESSPQPARKRVTRTVQKLPPHGFNESGSPKPVSSAKRPATQASGVGEKHICEPVP